MADLDSFGFAKSLMISAKSSESDATSKITRPVSRRLASPQRRLHHDYSERTSSTSRRPQFTLTTHSMWPLPSLSPRLMVLDILVFLVREIHMIQLPQ
jgi:hypothetical protein